MEGVASIGWCVIAAAIAAYVATSYRDYNRLKAFKGPWMSGWSSLWLVRAVGSGKMNIRLAKVCKKYGE